MFFKRNENQENDCDVYQGKHEVTTKYFVKLDNGQFVAKNWYDNAVSQGTGEYWKYTMNELKDAKQMQREYGGTIYEEVEDKYVRPYQGKPRKTGGHVSNHDESEIGDRPETVVKQSKHVTFISSNPNSKLPDEFLIDGVKYCKHVNKPHVNADMAVNVKLDTADAIKSINDLKEALNGITDHPKIHELPKNDQFSGLNVGDHIFPYSFVTANSKTIELLKQPNTRLAIIEDDEDETV